MNFEMHATFWVNVFVFFIKVPRSGIARSFGRSVFNILRNHHMFSIVDFTNLRSHQQGTKVPFSPHPSQHLIFVAFFYKTYSDKWACSNPCPLSLGFNPTISSSVIPFSSCLQSLPASGSFPVSQLFASGGQSIGVSASASVLPKTIQDWFPLGLTRGSS